MKPVYFFPFTRLDSAQARTVDLFFSGMQMLTLDPSSLTGSPMSELAGRGVIAPVSVDTDRQHDLEARVRSFMDWARIHQGNQRNLGALIRETPYFRKESDVTAIQSQIRTGMDPDGRDKADTSNDPLLFLRLAEIWDRDNEAIEDQLMAVEKNNSALFASLRGEAGLDGASVDLARPRDPGAERTGERIAAWSRGAAVTGLFDPETDCPVLVTTSQAVFDYLIRDAREVINGLDIDSIKVHEQGCAGRASWQRDFDDTLVETSTEYPPSWDDACGCCDLSGRIRSCVFPDGSLNKRFEIPGRQVAVCLVELNS